jgi:glycosyltransferase involved in cell wall biosynthesis
MIHVVLDLRCINSQMTGIGRYAENLGLSLSSPSTGFRVSALVAGRDQPRMFDSGATYVAPADPDWDHLGLPDFLKAAGADIFHSPFFLLPSLRVCRYIGTVHDVIPMSRPDLCPESFIAFFNRHFPNVVRRADQLVTVSEFSKSDILKRVPLDPTRVTAIHEPVSPKFSESRSDPTQLKRLGLLPGYILYLGAIDRRKNLNCLLEAYGLLRLEGEAPPLVIGGASSGDAYDAARELDKVGLSNHVTLLGRVPEDLLPTLYGAAAVFVFPSLYEGFGLPVVEAMACGTPVVASKATSIPEVAGDAALLVDPTDAPAWKVAIRRILNEKDLREELVRRGRQRAEELGLARHRDQLVQLYKKVLGVSR